MIITYEISVDSIFLISCSSSRKQMTVSEPEQKSDKWQSWQIVWKGYSYRWAFGQNSVKPANRSTNIPFLLFLTSYSVGGLPSLTDGWQFEIVFSFFFVKEIGFPCPLICLIKFLKGQKSLWRMPLLLLTLSPLVDLTSSQFDQTSIILAYCSHHPHS